MVLKNHIAYIPFAHAKSAMDKQREQTKERADEQTNEHTEPGSSCAHIKVFNC